MGSIVELNKLQKLDAIRKKLLSKREVIQQLNDDKLHLPKVNRRTIKWAIQDTLNVTSPNLVNNWLNLMLAKGIISLNPNSSQARHEKKVYMPSNDSMYFFDWEIELQLSSSVNTYI